MSINVVEEPLQAPRPALAGRFYRPELDLMRLAAFLMVFLSHSIPISEHSPRIIVATRYSCALGVPLFFALSAFLITELLVREKAATGTINIRAFYVRRILRIWPLYFFVLLVGYILTHVIAGQQMPLTALLAYLLLIGNWYTVSAGFLPLGLGPIWSIGIEEQFYLTFPSLLLHLTRRMVIIASILIWLLCQIVVAVLCLKHASISPVIWANSFTHFQYFALGILLSLALNGSRPKFTVALRIALVSSGLITLFLANYVFNTYVYTDVSSIRHTYPGYLITGLGVILILLAFLGTHIPAFLKSLVWLGKISYGLYVYHLPCILLSAAAGAAVFHRPHGSFLFPVLIGFPLTVSVSALSYRYLETPFLRLKSRFEVIESRAI